MTSSYTVWLLNVEDGLVVIEAVDVVLVGDAVGRGGQFLVPDNANLSKAKSLYL